MSILPLRMSSFRPMLAALAIVIVFPQISLWIPQQIFGR